MISQSYHSSFAESDDDFFKLKAEKNLPAVLKNAAR